jgi:hypothetical protein
MWGADVSLPSAPRTSNTPQSSGTRITDGYHLVRDAAKNQVAADPAVAASPAGERRRFSVRIALGVALATLLGGIVIASLQHPLAVARTNGAGSEKIVGAIAKPVHLCQSNESIPHGTTAVVLWLSAFTGPRVEAKIVAGSAVIARGERGPGWSGRGVRVSLDRPIPRSLRAKVCFAIAPKDEVVSVFGDPAGRSGAAQRTAERMRIEYLRPASYTWLSKSGSIGRGLSLGRIPSGRWAPIVAILLIVAVLVGVSGLVARGLR